MMPGELFQPGRPKTGGRVKGSRNRLSHAFVEALCAEFEQYGAEAIRIARIEKPVEFLKVVAGLLPREFEITDSRLKDLTDEELDFVLALAKRRITANLERHTGSPEGGEVAEANPEPARLLQAVPETT
jgi:hypothetical protein